MKRQDFEGGRRRSAGFTLIELLVSLAVVAILAMVAVPSYSSITNRNRVAGEVNQLVTAMQYARSEAVKQGLNAVVCVSMDQSSCSAASTDFNSGYIVFVDANSNGTRDAAEPLLRVQPQPLGGDTAVASNSLSKFTFNREGFVASLPTNPVSVFFAAQAGADLPSSRCLMVSLTGRTMVKSPVNGTCS